MNPKEFRKKVALGEFSSPTSGYCDGHVQANMVALPSKYAKSFEEFAKLNNKAIPVLEIIKGGYKTKVLADDANLLNEIPQYNIIKDGKVIKSVKSIEEYYDEDLVFFLIGCSFTFEKALVDAGIKLRHMEQKRNVSMYNTNIDLNPYDMFKGKMVVSMRPVKKELVAEACVVTSHYPATHGSPIQVGYPEMIGIKDLSKPDYGDFVDIYEDEIPLFWPCGVTPQNALRDIKIPFAITHKPGHMFVGDKRDSEYYVG
jgi:uncharacterized protein YcsI (UPF0317 family)